MPIPHLRPTEHNPPANQYQRSWRDLQQRSPAALTGLLRFLSTIIGAAFRPVKKLFKKPRKKRGFVRFWLPLVGIVLLLFVFSIFVVFAWFSRDLPDPDKISDRTVAQSTRIYARDGKTLLYEIHGDQRRTVVRLEDISPDVVNATIAIEDKDFYKHGGISIVGIIRAIWRDVTTGSTQGGSTITQQFVKNAILTSEKKITRKIKEWVLAYQIERRFTKQQILKLYFNEIPYGSNAYGAEAASETYFGKPAKNVSLAEAAILAALPQAPSFYSPYGNNADRLLSRAHYILDIMVKQGYITQDQADTAKKEEVLKNVKPKRETIIAPHFVFYVRDLLAEKYGERVVEQGGLRVVTTLDIDKQLAAEGAIAAQAETNQKKYKASNTSLVSIDPKTGQVLAMVGSKDYFDASIDGNVNVALSLQQPGSSIKPIVYATAFSRGFTPETILFDLSTHFKMSGAPDYVPHNYDGKERGPLPMRKTLAGSLNIPAVKTLFLAGIDRVIDQAQKMGYTTWEDRSRLGLSLVLGGAEVKLIEHTAAFGSLAADGDLHTTAPIMKVEDKNGKLLEEYKDSSTNVLDKNVARTVSDVLSDNKARSFIFGERNWLTLPDRPVAAKTGTTQEFRDAWTVGYTSATGKGPAIVTGVWVGNNDNSPMRSGADGSVVAAPIWNSYMRKAMANTKAESFKKPVPSKTTKPILQGRLEGEAPIKVDAITGKEIPASCLDKWPQGFIVEKSVKAVHTILYYIDPNDPAGPPPPDPTKNPQFSSWDAPIQRWAKKNGYVESRPPVESCSLRTEAPSVLIVAPVQNATIRDTSVSVSVTTPSPKPIIEIAYYLDGVALAQPSAAATTATVNLESVPNGYHTIRVVVKDDVGNTGEASVSINILRDLSASSIYFLSPPYNASFPAGSQIDLRAFVFDPSGIASSSFQVTAPDGSTSTIEAAVGGDSIASATWQSLSLQGSCRAVFKAVTVSSKTLQTDALLFTLL
ncbi:MAG: transglycosylase domain-containing protein [Candidatus Kerfeldbacteria bacterium]